MDIRSVIQLLIHMFVYRETYIISAIVWVLETCPGRMI